MKAKRKDPHAVALAKKSAKSRLTSLTPQQRSEQARRAVQARWRKAKQPADAKPGLWWRLWAFDTPVTLDNLNPPELVFYSRDEEEVHGWARKAKARGDDRIMGVDSTGERPRRDGLRITRRYEPDVGAQIDALQMIQQERGQK
jgi:hypothetical protein